MDLNKYQKEIETILSPIRHPRVGCVIGLTEELGELCKEIMALEIYGKDGDKAKLGLELADVFISLSELASAYEIDLEDAVSEKLAQIRTQAGKWAEKFGPNLARKREKMD